MTSHCHQAGSMQLWKAGGHKVGVATVIPTCLLRLVLLGKVLDLHDLGQELKWNSIISLLP